MITGRIAKPNMGELMVEISPIVRTPQSLADGAYDALKQLIIEGRAKPGTRLNIEELARQLGISATPVREALPRLESEGLVERVPGAGYRATPRLGIKAFEELYEARLVMEPVAAFLAATRARSTHLNQVSELADAMHSIPTGGDYRDYHRFAESDAALHEIVADAAGNRYIAAAVRSLHSHVQLSRLYQDRGVVDAGEALPEHEGLLKAILERDPAQAEAAMRHHLERSRDRLREILLTENGGSTTA